MSADNGVYILETAGPEFRVSDFGAIDNITWDQRKRDFTNDPVILMENARKYYNGCEVFTTREAALQEAVSILNQLPVCEYGIKFILRELRDKKF